MRVRAHGMQQATDYPGPVAVLVTVLVVVTVFVVVVVTRPVTLTRLVTLTWLVIVIVIVVVTVLVIVVRAAPAVHIIQHARENALPHINTYQGRALAN
jgi:Na+/proline symporter